MVARLLTTLLLLALVFPAAAQEGFYSARVPVADRSDAALTQGIRDALRRVLIRVSGNDDIVDKTGVAACHSRGPGPGGQLQLPAGGSAGLFERHL